jgi:hypothetical protein
MNTRLNHPEKTDHPPDTRRCGKLLTALDMLALSAIVVSVCLFGMALAIDADEDHQAVPVAAAGPVAANSAPNRLKLDNVPVRNIDDSAPSSAGAKDAPVEIIWQLDEPKVVTADVTDSTGRATVVPVAALRSFTTIQQRSPKQAVAAPVNEILPVGKAHVWQPAPAASAESSATSSPSGTARVARPSVAVASNDSATGRAHISLPAPVKRPQPKSGRATVSSPLPIHVAKATTGRARVSLAAADKQSPFIESAKNDGKTFGKFVLDLDDSPDTTVSVEKRAPVVSEPLPPTKQSPIHRKQTVQKQDRVPLKKYLDQFYAPVVTDVVEALAQVDQPKAAPAPKANVPPTPVPGTPDTPDTPDTLEYAGFKPIGELTVDISVVKGEDPPDLARPEFDKVEPVVLDTAWIDQTLAAPIYAFYHQPLYFEDPNAERCGETWGILQPAVSAAQFYLTIPALPYLIGALPPKEPVESLGDCAWGCKFRYRDAYLPPLSLKGAALQGAAVTGLIFLIP